MVAFQRNFVYSRIISESQVHVVYPGLDFGSGGALKAQEEGGGGGGGNNMLLSVFEAPGVVEGASESRYMCLM
jgi:hypothetical protein